MVLGTPTAWRCKLDTKKILCGAPIGELQVWLEDEHGNRVQPGPLEPRLTFEKQGGGGDLKRRGDWSAELKHHVFRFPSAKIVAQHGKWTLKVETKSSIQHVEASVGDEVAQADVDLHAALATFELVHDQETKLVLGVGPNLGDSSPATVRMSDLAVYPNHKLNIRVSLLDVYGHLVAPKPKLRVKLETEGPVRLARGRRGRKPLSMTQSFGR